MQRHADLVLREGKTRIGDTLEQHVAPLASSTTTLQSPSPTPFAPNADAATASIGAVGGSALGAQQHHQQQKVHKQPSNVSHHSKQTIMTSSSASQHFQQLPPTPPLAHTQLTSTRIQQTGVTAHTTLNQTLPSFLVTPSPTPATTSQSSGTKSKLGLQHSPLSKSTVNTPPAETSTPTLRAASTGRTLNKFNQDLDDEQLKPAGDGDTATKSSAKLFADVDGNVPMHSPTAAVVKSGRNLAYTIGSISSGQENSQTHGQKSEGSMLKELSNITDNLVRPTPDDKKRSYYPKNLSVRGDQVDSTGRPANQSLNKKLDLSTVSSVGFSRHIISII